MSYVYDRKTLSYTVDRPDGVEWTATEPGAVALWKLWRVMAAMAADRCQGVCISAQVTHEGESVLVLSTVYAPQWGYVAYYVSKTGEIGVWESEQDPASLEWKGRECPPLDDSWWSSGRWNDSIDIPV